MGIDYRVSIGRTLSGDILLSVRHEQGDSVSDNWFAPDGDIGKGLEYIGISMRRHYNSKLKKQFLAEEVKIGKGQD